MHTNTKRQRLFDLGQVVATPGANNAMARTGTHPSTLLRRHVAGDWGDLSEADGKANDSAVETGERILSSYFLSDETKLWIITDAEINEHGQRCATTFLLPEEY